MADDHSNILRGPEIPVEIPNLTLGQYMFAKLKSHDPYDVLMCEAESGRTITPPEFLALSTRVAEALGRSGMRPGDVVVLVGAACIDVYATATGVLFRGGIVSPMDRNWDCDMFRALLNATEPKFVFCDADVAEKVEKVLSQLENTASLILLNHDPSEETAFLMFEKFITSEVVLKDINIYSSANAEDEVAFLVCSSGSTGFPKPVMITNKSLLYQVIVWSFISSFNKILSCPAITFSYFFWISGVFLYATVVCFNYEITIVQKLEAEHVLRVVERHKPVWGLFSPALIKYLTAYPRFECFNVSSLVLIITGGCSLQKVVVEKIKERWGSYVACRQSYGMTEVTGTATTSSMGDDVLSVGKLIPGFQMKIIGTENGNILGAGQEGEIFLKSPSVMKGYLKNDEATREVLKNNWYRTGDTGYFTHSGVIYITGRIKDLIKVNGIEISPAEIEEVIMSVPGVADVGVAGIKVGEENFIVMALIVKTKGFLLNAENIIKVVNESLPEHKQLHGGVKFVDAIPRTPSGKMKRFDLMKLAEAFYKKE